MTAGALRTVPLAGETTASLIHRIAARYGLELRDVLHLWTCRNSPARHDGGGVRADAELVLNSAGRQVLAELCRAAPEVLARALPAFSVDDADITTGEEAQARWRAAGAVVGPAGFGCRLCTARRTGEAVRVVRYAPRWQRVCVRHGRWLLDADADQPLEHLDVRGVPEVVVAQQQWASVVRRAMGAGVEPEAVFAGAHAVVAHWWTQALYWEREEIWPRRLHRIAGGNAGAELESWRIVGRDAAIFPEVVAVAGALLDPAMADLAWSDSGGERPRPLGADGQFCRRLGERVGRDWLGPLISVDHGSPLGDWTGSVIRGRRDNGHPSGWVEDPWRLRREKQPATMAAQLRVMVKEGQAGGSGTRWRAMVPAERRIRITGLVDEAAEQLAQVRGAHSGVTAEVARQLLHHLSHSADLIEQVLALTVDAALKAGVSLEDVAQWSKLPADVLAEPFTAGPDTDEEE
ncbi:DNA-binding protein [Streptomyces sp. NPDC001093]|uniref:DNA-binding protein n=1 Tax=Streptomyces sp. NPDC001093 TaxID=3154376 RepID=UPI00331AD28A